MLSSQRRVQARRIAGAQAHSAWTARAAAPALLNTEGRLGRMGLVV